MNIANSFLGSTSIKLIDLEMEDHSSNSETESLSSLPLPQQSENTENSSRASSIPSESIAYPLSVMSKSKMHSGTLSNATPLSNQHISRYPIKNGLPDPTKIFKKLRCGGINIVQNVRRKIGNSYNARKERYIEKILKNQENISPIILRSRCASCTPTNGMKN